MPRPAPLPAIFKEYEERVYNVRYVSDTEYSSSCPDCAGDDRCRWFLRGSPLGWCRQCNSLFFPTGVRPTKDDLDRWRLDQIEREQQELSKIARTIATLKNSRLWEKYHKEMPDEGIDYWTRRGISPKLQEWWKFGWVDEWLYHCEGKDYVSPTATIPLFGKNYLPMNIKHRLIYPHNPKDKYRLEFSGVKNPLFLTNPRLPLDGEVIAIEGEIKAAVVWANIKDIDRRVVGLPGCTPGKHIVDEFKGADSVVLVMDPGSHDQAKKLVKDLGPARCKVLITPEKIDDAILAGHLLGSDIEGALKMATPGIDLIARAERRI